MKILNPMSIFNNFKSGKIDGSSAIEKLIINFQNTEDHTKEIQYIDIFSEIYKIYRSKDDQFEIKLIKLFKSAIQKENYVYVLYYIVDVIKELNKTLQEVLMDEIIKKYALFYDIVPEEAKFIVEIDYLDPTYTYTKQKIQFRDNYKEKIVAHSKKDFFYYNRYFMIKKNHIIGIKLEKNVDGIPESIQALKKLKYLIIYTGMKKKFIFPKSMELLSQLKYLKINSYYQLEIPEILKERVQKSYIQRYLEDGVCLDDAKILSNIDIIGWSFTNLEKDELYAEDPEWYNLADVDVWDYKLDEMGHVIGIYIKPREERPRLTYFPLDLCYFKHLKILILWLNELETIPEAIINLKTLKTLEIVNFGKKLTKISESVRSFLDILESLTLDTKISKIH